MSVAEVVSQAHSLGFTAGDPEWANLGQGQPETGPIPGAPMRLTATKVEERDFAYGPVLGLPELRAAVADYYNRLHRAGNQSRYGPQNVAIAQGGRLALGRCLLALERGTIGYQSPDYSALQGMLTTHRTRLSPCRIESTEEDGFRTDTRRVAGALEGSGLSAFVLSNPCNPTGRSLRGGELEELLGICRDRACALLLDEFYSAYVYDLDETGRARAAESSLSAAALVDDVERDQVIIFDGLTKGFRYPGLRLAWMLGPSDWIERVERVAAEFDGGASTLVQRSAIDMLAPGVAEQEGAAVRELFAAKRNLMVDGLREAGISVPSPPDSTFYVWGKLDRVAPSSDATEFVQAGMRQKVLTLPGHLFDIDPGGLRGGDPYGRWVRFSFGPPIAELEMGLERLGEITGRVGGHNS